jgi:hypothetical protein
MGTKSRGRGVAATFGLLVVLAGLIGGAALWVTADRRPQRAVDGFARGAVGCTTTLEFIDTGTFFVFEETTGAGAAVDCEPTATPGAGFEVVVSSDGRPLAFRSDSSVAYATTTAVGRSVARFEITTPGQYEIVVTGADVATVAAIGRDPSDGVAEIRQGAFLVGVGGVVLGGLMLLLAGRRSRRATVVPSPITAPARPVDDGPEWPPATPHVQLPIRPTQPERPVGPWAPPTASERRDPPPPAE